MGSAGMLLELVSRIGFGKGMASAVPPEAAQIAGVAREGTFLDPQRYF
jgi:hypothetical protein